MKYIKRVSEIPDGEHYIALQNQNIYIPGDERSRTNPGHGYSASTQSYLTFRLFDDKAECENWVAKQQYPEKFKILVIKTCNTTTKVTVNIS